jgi:chromatin structure-remodeling complex protein RSC7
VPDGRWVVDDYNEEKALAEITEKGFKPGDLVGDLQETSNIAAEAAALNATASREAGKQDRGSGLGIYRAGGPTTIFGSSGWGPYSDGPLNAVRKSLYNREGLNEENWMHVAAQRTLEAGEEWKRLRKDALRVFRSAYGEDVSMSLKRAANEVDVEDVGEERPQQPKRRKVDNSLPLGVYEPQTGMVLCKLALTNVLYWCKPSTCY